MFFFGLERLEKQCRLNSREIETAGEDSLETPAVLPPEGFIHDQ